MNFISMCTITLCVLRLYSCHNSRLARPYPGGVEICNIFFFFFIIFFPRAQGCGDVWRVREWRGQAGGAAAAKLRLQLRPRRPRVRALMLFEDMSDPFSTDLIWVDGQIAVVGMPVPCEARLQSSVLGARAFCRTLTLRCVALQAVAAAAVRGRYPPHGASAEGRAAKGPHPIGETVRQPSHVAVVAGPPGRQENQK